MSFSVTWLPPTVSYSLVESEMYSICEFSAICSHFQVTSVKSRRFRVTSDQLRTCDTISCNVTNSCELRLCWKWNAQCARVFGFQQPLPGDFQSNDVTSGHFRSPEVMWHHFLSVTASYCRVSAFYSHFHVTSGQMTSLLVTSGHLRSRHVISSHMTASYCELQPCRKWKVQYMRFSALYNYLEVTSSQMTSFPSYFPSSEVTTSFPVTWPTLLRVTALQEVKCTVYEFSAFCSHFQVTSKQKTSLPGHFQSPEVVTSFSVTWLPPTASYSLVGSEMYSIREFSVLYNHFQVTSSQMTSLPGQLRSPEVTYVISCHVTAPYCKPQPCKSEMYSIRDFSAFYRHFQVTSVKWCHFWATSCH